MILSVPDKVKQMWEKEKMLVACSIEKHGRQGGGGVHFLHYTDMKKFVKNLLLQNRLSEFEIISQNYSLCDPFQKLVAKF